MDRVINETTYSFEGYCVAMDRVQARLRRVTGALNRAGVPYAAIGGNAVAVWVAKAGTEVCGRQWTWICW